MKTSEIVTGEFFFFKTRLLVQLRRLGLTGTESGSIDGEQRIKINLVGILFCTFWEEQSMEMRMRIGGGESCCDRLSDERERGTRECRIAVQTGIHLHVESIFLDACIVLRLKKYCVGHGFLGRSFMG